MEQIIGENKSYPRQKLCCVTGYMCTYNTGRKLDHYARSRIILLFTSQVCKCQPLSRVLKTIARRGKSDSSAAGAKKNCAF